MVVGTLLGLEMIYRLDPDAIDEASVVAALRSLLRAARGGARAWGAVPVLSAVPDPSPLGDT